jgi:hypothetical protein
MPRLNTEGRNRFVLLIGRYAIKFPSPRCWRDFLFGILNNLNEREAHANHPAYCPVLWSAPGAVLIVMPRVKIMDDTAFSRADAPAAPGVERKASSWGWLDGRLVAVEYGWPG